jgi:putative DNA primase/helicase
MTQICETTYAGWPLIEIYGVGPDGSCHCPKPAECKTPGKHPRGLDWQKADRVDMTEVLTRRPRANVGVRTGAPAGFWVLDIDQGGMDAMAALRAEHGPLPITRVHKTGGGTFHYFFAMPDFDVTNRRGSLPKGIDARGTGGQVVLPPSVSHKGEYTVVRDAEIADAPDWLLDMLRPKEGLKASMDDVAAIVADEEAFHAADMAKHEASPYETKIIDGEIARLEALKAAATPNGEGYDGEPWDTTTYMVACQLFELANAPWAALDPEDVAQIVFKHAPRDPGFDTARVQEKIYSARAKVGDKARVDTRSGGSNTAWFDEIDAPTSPTATPTQRAKPTRGDHDPDDFFDKTGIKAIELGMAVMDRAPIRWGQNQRWWSYDECGVWVEDRDAIVNRCIDILGNRYRQAHSSNTEVVAKRFAEHLDIDNPDSRFINFRNGMLDWKTQTMHPHSPDHRSTVQIPHEFQPDATCPRFEAFLESVMSPDYQQIVWEAIGYLLYLGNPLQIAFLLHGSGGNGKGTLIKVLTAMLGKENLAHQSLDALNGDKFAAANLFGKIANIAGDIDATFQESTARFKMLTGEDRFSGEYKYGDSFGFNNFAVPLFSANKIPGSADVSKGYLRRWVNIEFDRVFTGEPIAGLGESLAATEIPGVIAKGLKHLPGLIAQGHFTIQGEAEKGRENFAHSIDQVRQWTEDETMPVDNGPIRETELYGFYRAWAERNGTGKLKASDFYSRLEGAGFRRSKIKGNRVFHGLTHIPYVQQVPSHHDDFFTGGR